MLDTDFFGFFTNFMPAEWVQSALDFNTATKQWILEKYRTAPALMFGVALAVALPAVAITGPMMRFLVRYAGKRRPLVHDAGVGRTQPASIWRQHAWLEFQSSTTASYPISQKIVRIGRETDNDLCLSHPTAHRYHAILEQTPEAEYIISYIGDPDRDGMLINGHPAERQRLRGGEVIELGAIKLRFALSTA